MQRSRYNNQNIHYYDSRRSGRHRSSPDPSDMRHSDPGRSGRHRSSSSFKNPMDPLARWIYEHLSGKRNSSTSHIPGANEKLNRELQELHSDQRSCVQDYYVRKISNALLISLCCLAVLILVLVAEHQQDRRIMDGVIERPGYGESGKDQSLLLSVEMAESEAIDVYLDARSYTSSQVTKLLKSAVRQLEENLPGENASLDEVRLPLNLPTSLENGAVSVEYYISPGNMIDDNGSICGEPEKDGTLVTISAELTCQKKTSTFECAARVYPPILSAKEQFQENVRSAVEAAQTKDPTNAQVQLPDSVDGRALRWSYPKDSSLRLIIILVIILPIAFWAREDSKVHDAAKERLSQLELDYSQLLWKLTMLLSAGLTIRGAFTRIADQYDAEHTKRHYVYEEMKLTLREMKSGVPEATAYENFGRRCSLPSYIKLGSLLSQNLKKGAKGLTGLLEHEAVLSMEQHKMAVRKLGERAGVKMLLPMILMFGVVLIILMVPAFLSM